MIIRSFNGKRGVVSRILSSQINSVTRSRVRNLTLFNNHLRKYSAVHSLRHQYYRKYSAFHILRH